VSTTQLCPPTYESELPDAASSCITHTTAVGTTDTLHYVFISRGTPSLLAARTQVLSTIVVNWDAFLSANDTAAESIHFSSTPDVVVAVMFTQVGNPCSGVTCC
jgi:hypothetical protein